MFNENNKVLIKEKAKILINKGVKLKKVAEVTNLSYSTVKRIKASIYSTNINPITSKGRKNKLTINDEKIIIDFFINHASYFNFKHFYEYFVLEQMGYDISYSTMKRIFDKYKIASHYSRRSTKREYKIIDKVISNKENNKINASLENKLKYQLAFKYAHPIQPKLKYFGEVIEADASIHCWVDNKKFTLHIFVDKATSVVLGYQFEEFETLKGYYKAFKMVLNNYGIPAKIITDNRSIFKDNDIGNKTNFRITCDMLGIELKTTSVAQTKGTVERKFRTFQDRLSSELNFNNINDITSANEYVKEFIEKHNSKYLSNIDDTLNVFECQIPYDIDKILSIFSKRKVNGHIIKYKNKQYIPLDNKGERIYLINKTEVIVVESLDGGLFIVLNTVFYGLEEVPDIVEYSIQFDREEKRERKKYIPPADHPWRKLFSKIFK